MTAQAEAGPIESPRERRFAAAGEGPITARTPVPRAAKWLGALGALPFVFLAAVGALLDGPLGEQASLGLALYGAVILSFLGGVHWGLAISGSGPANAERATFRRLAISVVPALVGWGALFLREPIGLMVLAAAFAVLVLFDTRASRKGEAPAWYPMLRWPLTMAVVASLVVAALGW